MRRMMLSCSQLPPGQLARPVSVCGEHAPNAGDGGDDDAAAGVPSCDGASGGDLQKWVRDCDHLMSEGCSSSALLGPWQTKDASVLEISEHLGQLVPLVCG